ncbi:MAG TPA: FAD-dependent oxidoreductase [Gaiellaceae bacterium]|nr:FAD-dependent oxidoreductase [Gaiellaceae bacterium]
MPPEMWTEMWPAAAQTRGPLPETADTVVIGGGLVGAAVAYYLAKEGGEVLLVERGELNREASGTNAGSFHFQIALHQLTERGTAASRERLLGDLRLHLEAARLWWQLEDELEADLRLHRTGGLMVAETEEELQLLRDKHAIEEEAGLETHVLETAELRAFAPYLAHDLAGATWCPSEGHADPFLPVPLFIRRALELGAEIRAGVDVTEITPDLHVRTTAGTVRAGRVVNAAGAWARELAARSGIDLPTRAVPLHVNVTEPRARMLEPLVQHIGRRLTLKQTDHGTFIIGGGWPGGRRGLSGRHGTSWRSAAGNAAVAVRVMPSLSGVRLLRTWTGVMAFTNDLEPVVGEVAALPGYFVCVAMSGFTLAPLLGRMVARHLAHGEPIPAAYSPDRHSASMSRGR